MLRRTSRSLARLAVLAVLVALDTTTGSAAARTPALSEVRSCPLGRTGVTARCAVLAVPENRARPGGRTLRLRVIVIPARTPRSSRPILFLSGGPGQAATDQADYHATSWARHDGDVVLMDMRGTGGGNALDCPLPPAEPLQSFMHPIFAEGPDFYRACRARLERTADLTQYTSIAAAHDLDDLRQALGVKDVNLLAGSYGTRLAITYMKAYPGRVHAALLSGLVPTESRAPLPFAATTQRSFDQLAEQCRVEPACARAFPDPTGDLRAVLARLIRGPASVEVSDPRTGKPTMVRLDASSFGEGLRVMLYSATDGRRIPLLLSRALAGDYRPFASAAAANGVGVRGGLRLGLLLSVSCSEDVSRIAPDEIAPSARDSFIGDYRLRAQVAACGVWARGTVPDWYYRDTPITVPSVLLSGELDPVTPPTSAEAAARTLRNSRSFVVPGGHVEENECTASIGGQLFRTGQVDGIDAGCTAAIRYPPFAVALP